MGKDQACMPIQKKKFWSRATPAMQIFPSCVCVSPWITPSACNARVCEWSKPVCIHRRVCCHLSHDRRYSTNDCFRLECVWLVVSCSMTTTRKRRRRRRRSGCTHAPSLLERQADKTYICLYLLLFRSSHLYRIWVEQHAIRSAWSKHDPLSTDASASQT